MMYTEKVMDHFMNPRNVGELPEPDGVGEVGNARCGDIMKIYINVKEDRIVDVKFKTFGCCAAVATSSVATELIKGKTVAQALKVSNQEVVRDLGGLPPVKLHCSVLAQDAIQAAVKDYYERKGIDCPYEIEIHGDCHACSIE